MAKKTLSDLDENIAHIVINEQSFEHLYRTYWKGVFGIIYHYTKDKEISSELAQELFATIWEKGTSLNIQKDIRSYLFRAAKLEAFDYIRTNVRRKQILDNLAPSLYQAENHTENMVMHNELRTRLNLLIDKLPNRCQEIYSLSQNQGLKNDTIAKMLSISEKTVEYHLYRAIALLKESLGVQPK